MKAPHEYSRRVLVCVVGMSPAVVTETLYALAVQRTPAFVPTEIHMISTSEGLERARLMLVAEGKAYLRQLVRDYGLPAPLFGPEQMHVIRSADGEALADIRTPRDNAAAADTICALLGRLSADPDCALHVSIAGGRKTMGYYLGYALTLLGRDQDRLSHVLVSPDYESAPDFFYPAPKPDAVILHNARKKPLDAHRAVVELADIPFVRLRDSVPRALLKAPSFEEAVQAAERAQHAPNLHIDLSDPTAVLCNGQRASLSPQDFVFYAWLAERCAEEVAPGGSVMAADFYGPNTSLRSYFKRFGDAVFPNEAAAGTANWLCWQPSAPKESHKTWIHQRVSRLNEALSKALGPHGARPFLVQKAQGKGRQVAYWLALATEQIRIEPIAARAEGVAGKTPPFAGRHKASPPRAAKADQSRSG